MARPGLKTIAHRKLAQATRIPSASIKNWTVRGYVPHEPVVDVIWVLIIQSAAIFIADGYRTSVAFEMALAQYADCLRHGPCGSNKAVAA